MSFQCELCGLLFPSEKNLSTHRSKFCAGSDLHKRVGSRLQQQMVEESVQPAALTRYLLEGGRPPEALGALGNLEDLSVAELRARVTADAGRQAERKAQAERAAGRAQRRLAAERAKTELQQQEMKARMASMRAAEVQARVELRVAERKLETAELEGEAERQGETLDALRRQEAELQDQRRQAEAAAARGTASPSTSSGSGTSI